MWKRNRESGESQWVSMRRTTYYVEEARNRKTLQRYRTVNENYSQNEIVRKEN